MMLMFRYLPVMSTVRSWNTVLLDVGPTAGEPTGPSAFATLRIRFPVGPTVLTRLGLTRANPKLARLPDGERPTPVTPHPQWGHHIQSGQFFQVREPTALTSANPENSARLTPVGSTLDLRGSVDPTGSTIRPSFKPTTQTINRVVNGLAVKSLTSINTEINHENYCATTKFMIR
jgi:hypothetical protein